MGAKGCPSESSQTIESQGWCLRVVVLIPLLIPEIAQLYAGGIGNTGCSDDALVEPPLSILWWGGPGPGRMVCRHTYAPIPVYANGIMYVQGEHDIIAVDAYNGRELWNHHDPGLEMHCPARSGRNIVCDNDSVYAHSRSNPLECVRLERTTGRKLGTYKMVLTSELKQRLTKSTAQAKGKGKKTTKSPSVSCYYMGVTGEFVVCAVDASTSAGMELAKLIYVFDRSSCRLLWRHEAEHRIPVYGLVADNKTVYFIDGSFNTVSSKIWNTPQGYKSVKSSLRALDIRTGKPMWKQADIAPTCVFLMLKDDVLVATRNRRYQFNPLVSKFPAAAYNAGTGEVLWKKNDLGPAKKSGRSNVLAFNTIIDDLVFLPKPHDLRTGKPKSIRLDPFSQRPEPFALHSRGFCADAGSGKKIVGHRNGAVGYQGIFGVQSQYSYPELRPACSLSLIPAGGIMLNAESGNTCVCPYNYHTSAALFPNKHKKESWSIYWRRSKDASKDIARLQVNCNALGDRIDGADNAWMSLPRASRVAQSIPVSIEGNQSSFRYNSDFRQVKKTARPYIYNSGLVGPLQVVFRASASNTYKVRLHFCEHEEAKPGERVFSIDIEGKTVGKVDIAGEVGARTALVKTFTGVRARDSKLTVSLKPSGSKRPPILCGIEILRQ